MELLGSQTTAAGIFFLRYQNKHFQNVVEGINVCTSFTLKEIR